MGAKVLIHKDNIYVFHDENVLGTSLELKVAATSQKNADRAEAAVLSEIQRESKALSSYDSASEFSRWAATRGQAVPVSKELFETLSLFDQWRARTNGALDPAAEAVIRVWKDAAKADHMPGQQELAAAVQTVRQPHWSLDASAHTATHLSSTPLVLNTFVKSYIIDHAANAALATSNVDGVVVNIGGDVVVRGILSESIHVADPRSDAENSKPLAHLILSDMAVATSGNYRRGFDIQGQHYSHIVDPRTGQPADGILSATVIARNPVIAGALATSFSVMGADESRKLASSMSGVEYQLVQRDGSKVESAGWRKLASPSMDLAMAAAPAPPRPLPVPQAGVWNAAFELDIILELTHFDFPVRRPYVAIWIEDKDKFPVRTIALWQQKSRYLTDLKNWYRADRMRSMAEGSDLIGTITSATRSPGKYTVKWDGKDNAGKPVKAGTYFVNIEAAREHGTYQMMRQEMDFSGTPKTAQLPGGSEIASATIEYRKAQ